jgi:HEXXH motif-containing protein
MIATATALPVVDQLFSSGAFPPDDGTELLEDLRAETLSNRQATLVALTLQLAVSGGEVGSKAEALCERFLSLPHELRLTVVADTAFAVWQQGAARLKLASNPGLQIASLAQLDGVLDRALERARVGREDGDLPHVARYNVDPLLAEAAPPTYTFPSRERAQELEQRTAYRLSIFEEVARAALQRIRAAWPEAATLFPVYVSTIVHLPLADFRSASASRYAGTIFLTSDDRTLLEVEESLVHEWGHQVLYAAMELDPIVLDGEGREQTLPWSGAKRDFYGYFHALFVYTVLLRYLERISGRPPEEAARAEELYSHILRGAVRALPDFADASRFTPRGLQLAGLLRAVIEEGAERHPHLIDKGGSDGPG